MSAAELQIAVRVDCGVDDVRDSLWKQKTLVKTWLMRGTLHLARAADLPIFTAAMGRRWIKPSNAWFRYFNVTEAELWELSDAIGEALDGTPRTREQLIAAVARGRPERIREGLQSGWGGMLKPAARNGRLCFGPSRGQTVTFVNPRKWLGAWRAVEPGVALAEMARRYIHAYGPANKEDFAFWWGRWPGVGVAAWSAVQQELVQVDVEGWRAHVRNADLMDMASATRSRADRVRLLPNFDPYLMGHARRDHLFDRVHRTKVSRTAGWISPVILLDGRVEGVWAYTLKMRRLRAELRPFVSLPAAVLDEAKARAEDIATSMDATLERVTLA